MIDFMYGPLASDFKMWDGPEPKVVNIWRTQKGSLNFDKTIGLDLDAFLSEEYDITPASFVNSVSSDLMDQGVDLTAAILGTIENFTRTLKLEVMK